MTVAPVSSEEVEQDYDIWAPTSDGDFKGFKSDQNGSYTRIPEPQCQDPWDGVKAVHSYLEYCEFDAWGPSRNRHSTFEKDLENAQDWTSWEEAQPEAYHQAPKQTSRKWWEWRESEEFLRRGVGRIHLGGAETDKTREDDPWLTSDPWCKEESPHKKWKGTETSDGWVDYKEKSSRSSSRSSNSRSRSRNSSTNLE